MKRVTWFGVAIGMGITTAAHAQQQQDPQQQQQQQQQQAEPLRESVMGVGDSLRAMGTSVSVGLGLLQFSDNDTQEFTDTGASWDLRAAFGTKRLVAVEAAYIGTTNDIEAVGLDEDARLTSMQLETSARVNFFARRDTPWQPYALAGVGWGHFELANADINTSSVRDNDDVVLFPLGVGVAYGYRNFVFDLRGELRATLDDNIIQSPAPNANNTSLNMWGLNAKAGWQF